MNALVPVFALVFAVVAIATAQPAAPAVATKRGEDARLSPSFHAVTTAPGLPRVAALEPRVWACDFASQALGRPMRFLIVLPEGASLGGTRVPVVYFLHGRGRHERTLLEDAITRPVVLAARFAIVLPRGQDGWYVNAPAAPADRFADYLDEVLATAEEQFPVSREAAGRAIGGWSMGGYGATYTAGRRAGDFAAVASLIGVIDFPRAPVGEPSQNYAVPARFGTDPDGWRPLNPRLRLPRLRGTPHFIAYADQAFERQMNEVFIADARALGIEVEVLRLSGGHTFPMVEQSLPAALAFLERQLLPAAKR